MSVSVYEMAKKYYPRLWDRSRIDNLHNAGKLTDEEYQALINEEAISAE